MPLAIYGIRRGENSIFKPMSKALANTINGGPETWKIAGRLHAMDAFAYWTAPPTQIYTSLYLIEIGPNMTVPPDITILATRTRCWTRPVKLFALLYNFLDRYGYFDYHDLTFVWAITPVIDFGRLAAKTAARFYDNLFNPAPY